MPEIEPRSSRENDARRSLKLMKVTLGDLMSPEQKRQIEEARRESIEKTYDVCADGKKNKEHEYCNQVNNE